MMRSSSGFTSATHNHFEARYWTTYRRHGPVERTVRDTRRSETGRAERYWPANRANGASADGFIGRSTAFSYVWRLLIAVSFRQSATRQRPVQQVCSTQLGALGESAAQCSSAIQFVFWSEWRISQHEPNRRAPPAVQRSGKHAAAQSSGFGIG